jgi:hypothetical protein
MDKIEHYLDQVCRSIGGPRSLRQHIRQELREHLRDAVAEHRAAGMSEPEAIDRALADFGGPEQVRAELEATHGHRLLPVVIDKAMQWKEKTMKAKWLWMTWAHLMLVLVIALEVLTLTFATMFLVPRLEKIMANGLIVPAVFEESGAEWIPRFLRGLNEAGEHTTWIILGVVLVGGLFEWRVRSENKSFIRLSILGTAAVGLMVAVALTAGALTLSFFLGLPAMDRIAAPFGVERMASIDSSVSGIERALPNKDWGALQENASRALRDVDTLANVPFAIPRATSRTGTPTIDELRVLLEAAAQSLRQAQQAIQAKDAERLEAALRDFRKSYRPVQEAAKKSSGNEGVR